MKKRFNSYQEYLQSPEWEILRRLAHEQAGYCCRLCGVAEELHVHHRAYPKQYGTEQLSDLVVLCKKCHSNYHSSHSIDEREDDWFEIVKESAKFMQTMAFAIRRTAKELDDMASMQLATLAEMAEAKKTPTTTSHNHLAAIRDNCK